jgi:hypothetical protein
MFETKYYYCGKCGKFYKKNPKKCCRRRLQVIDKDTKDKLERAK